MFGLGKYKWPEVTFFWGAEQLLITLINHKKEKVIKRINLPRPDISYFQEGNKIFLTL